MRTDKVDWEIVSGRDLRLGDCIKTWWEPGRDTVIEIRPYQGSLAYLWPDGAAIARFVTNHAGMTIGLGDRACRVVAPLASTGVQP